MYPASASPRYIPGGTANTVICLLVAVIALGLRAVHVRENRELEALEHADELSTHERAKTDSDRRGAGFRYVY